MPSPFALTPRLAHRLGFGSLAVIAATLAACAPGDGTTTPDGEDDSAIDDQIRICAGSTTVKGIDVSVHNSTIDWVKVKGTGRVFAVARVSDGASHLDTQFATNWAGMKSVGLVRGVYQYFRPSQDPTAQADLLLSKIGTLGAGDLPPVIDVETADGVSTTKVVSAVKIWIDRIKAKTGVDPIVYSASGFWNTLPNTAQFASNILWVANYGATCPSVPSTWKKWSIWQYSETGSVSGVTGGIDLDVFNGSLADLQALTVTGTMPPPPPPNGGACTKDSDCNHGSTGAGVVCAAGACTDGCHADTDCTAGGTCDTSQPGGACSNALPPLGTACSDDAECSDGQQGTSRICGSTSKVCMIGCHATAADCPSGETCNETGPIWFCGPSAPPPPPPSACPVLTFPSGIKIQTVKDAATTASYTNHLKAGESAPLCFLDVTNLHDPSNGKTYTLSVSVATHFLLSELVGTEVSQGWGNFVLISPAAVTALETFREKANKAMTINSGFRGPKHQESVCKSLCGDPLGCAGTCSSNSRHMWGDAFDLPTAFYSSTYTNEACASGFKFTYLESGTHLHVDENPAYATCVMQ
jgi:lysozyme